MHAARSGRGRSNNQLQPTGNRLSFVENLEATFNPSRRLNSSVRPLDQDSENLTFGNLVSRINLERRERYLKSLFGLCSSACSSLLPERSRATSSSLPICGTTQLYLGR